VFLRRFGHILGTGYARVDFGLGIDRHVVDSCQYSIGRNPIITPPLAAESRIFYPKFGAKFAIWRMLDGAGRKARGSRKPTMTEWTIRS
jgi:hypothetical protein